jgi:sugar phosphate isomerase/epimerase
MQLLIFRALWGMTGPFEAQIERIAAAGYDGVDGFPETSTLPPAEFSALVASHGLKLIMATQVNRREQLEPALQKLAEYAPLKIGLHSGRDSMSREEGCAFIEEALRVEAAN